MGGLERFFRGGAAAGVRYSRSADSTVLQLALSAYKESLWATLCAAVFCIY
ncbi:hypothetical protein Mal52_45890 [Symmachiella dynata]|uniref:Uncharacterized protein n=1 Tax=Symmachiella dynata TaxID=2527995 RepID=A0A517ZUE0_9PLAN|nr:hypothetical protein Mal52_45890 [Symmachiella dynata]